MNLQVYGLICTLLVFSTTNVYYTHARKKTKDPEPGLCVCVCCGISFSSLRWKMSILRRTALEASVSPKPALANLSSPNSLFAPTAHDKNSIKKLKFYESPRWSNVEIKYMFTTSSENEFANKSDPYSTRRHYIVHLSSTKHAKHACMSCRLAPVHVGRHLCRLTPANRV